MKFPSLTLMTGAVVLASTIYARPSFFKRAAQAADVITCVATLLTTGQFTCQDTIGQDVKLVQGVTFPNISFDLTTPMPLISAKLSIQLMKFRGVSSIPLTQAKLNMSILDGIVKTSSVSADLPVTATGFAVGLDLPPTPVTIEADETAAFIKLLTGLATKDKYTLTMQGTADVQLVLSIFGVPGAVPEFESPIPGFGSAVPSIPFSKTVSITGIGISADITLTGANNFGGIITAQPNTVTAVTKDADTKAETVQFKVTISNPSAMAATLGAVVFRASDPAGAALGTVTIPNFKLSPACDNTLDAVLTADAAGGLDRYFPIASTGLMLALTADSTSSKYPIVAGVVASLALSLKF